MNRRPAETHDTRGTLDSEDRVLVPIERTLYAEALQAAATDPSARPTTKTSSSLPKLISGELDVSNLDIAA